MPQVSAAFYRGTPSNTSAIASVRRDTRASWQRAASARNCAAANARRVLLEYPVFA
jgi:hypothetical protein